MENLSFGGNTSCIEIRTAANECVIFDAGSGIRNLGRALTDETSGAPLDLKIFFTHFHWDHIQGLPFFAPVYQPQNRISFFTGVENHDLEKTLQGQMANPYFPVDLSQAASTREFHLLEPARAFETNGLTITPFPLYHPQHASGYRIEAEGRVVVYATDFEHGDPALDRILRDYAAGADVLICDAQYTPDEYEKQRGRGHSTWANVVDIARDARAGQLFLFHHDPTHDDEQMTRIAKEAQRLFENTSPAQEGLIVDL